jgi:hypothetical protein
MSFSSASRRFTSAQAVASSAVQHFGADLSDHLIARRKRDDREFLEALATSPSFLDK